MDDVKICNHREGEGGGKESIPRSLSFFFRSVGRRGETGREADSRTTTQALAVDYLPDVLPLPRAGDGLRNGQHHETTLDQSSSPISEQLPQLQPANEAARQPIHLNKSNTYSAFCIRKNHIRKYAYVRTHTSVILLVLSTDLYK